MPSSAAVARTRVSIPPRPATAISRAAALARLDEAAAHPIIALVAGPGSGKTMLLSEWAATRPTAWYEASEEDDDPAVFAAHVHAALQVAGAVDEWRPTLDAAINACVGRDGQVLVIDEAHRLPLESIGVALTYLVRYLPAGVTVVLSSRRVPALKEWGPWLARGRVATLGPAELFFTPQEVAALTEDAEAIHAATGGWPLAVDLMARHGLSPRRETALDEYLASEIWDDLAADDQSFLEACAVLEQWSAPLCRALTGRDDTLRRLADLGLLAPTASPDTWRPQPVLRDFLRKRAASPERHARAAGALEASGHALDAIPHRLAAGTPDAAAALLEKEAPALLSGGRHERLLGLLSALPALSPRLLLARGHAHRRANAFEAALADFQQAAADAAVAPKALAAAAAVYVDTVQPARAARLLRQAFRQTSPDDAEDRARILDLISENCVNEGRAAAALRYRRWGASLLTRPQRSVLDARILLRTGQLRAARALLQARQEAPAEAADGHRDDVLVLAYIAALEGDAGAAEAAARQALSQAHSPFTEAVAWMRLGHALQLQPERTLEEVIACYERAEAEAERTGVQRVRAEALMGLALAYAARGDVPRSYAHATEGMAITRSAGDTWLSAWLRLATGIAGVEGRHPSAADLLQQARNEMDTCRDAFGACVASLWQAVASGEGVEAAVARARDRGYGFLTERPSLFGPRRVLSQETPVPVESVLRVQCLGGFRAWRDGDEISPRAWKREKARELFLILLSRRGTAMQKETLMEALWPDATTTAAKRDFRVALHALSEALDPRRPRNAHARGLERRGTAYLLQSGAQVEIDADEMERLIGLASREPDASKSRTLWRRAVELYRGDFLEDYPYAEFAAGERERLRACWVRAAEHLAHAAEAAGDDDEALALAHAILARDRCWEEAWRVLMRVHARQSRAFMAARVYEECSQALDEELGVLPSDETEELYARLIP